MSQPEGSRRLRDQVCIVTGSSSGLGRAISLAYAREGGLVVCTDVRPQARAEVKLEGETSTDELIRKNGGRALFVKADVSKAEQVEAMVAAAVAEYGRIDVLVNNAGICVEAGRQPLRVHETPEDSFDLTMAVNAKSCFLTSKYVLAQMLRQDVSASGDRGWIINMASIYGLVGGNNNVAYCTSKGAVTNMTRQVALDYAGDGIHCNAICPGFTNTAMWVNTVKTASAEPFRARQPLHGIGTPEDIVGAAIFLASQEARWITGALLPVDGGYTAQ